MTGSISLSQYIDRALRPLRVTAPVGAGIFFGLLFSAYTLQTQITASEQLMNSISGHVASLVESQDRPELQRLLRTVGEKSHADIFVEEDGIVFASSRSIEDIDKRLPVGSTILRLQNGITFHGAGAIISMPVGRNNGPTNAHARIAMNLSLFSLFMLALGAFMIVALVGYLAAKITSNRIQHIVDEAIKPVHALAEGIRTLKNMKCSDKMPATGITELETIREATLETHAALERATAALAESRAKELATDAYRRLLHDLHTPIQTLNNMALLADNAAEYGAEAAAEAHRAIPIVAEQILMQIEAAKDNLNFETPTLIESDLALCVRDAALEARAANQKTIKIDFDFPTDHLIARFDPILMKRAVTNLVRNAIDACHEEVRVAVTQDASTASIQVMDDGNGIPQEDVGPYLKGRKKSTKGDRAALGLSAVNHIAHSHGGRVLYKLSPLGGACFEVRFSV